MPTYILRRLLQSVLILLGVSFITFFLLYILPADPVRQIAGRSATPQTVENIRTQLGLDQPFVVQYVRYLGALVQGDMGRSYLQKSQVASLIVEAGADRDLQTPVLKGTVEAVVGLDHRWERSKP